MSWQPLMTAGDGERIRQFVEEVADAITKIVPIESSAAGGGSPSLSGITPTVLADLALFFSYLHLALPGHGHDDTAMSYLDLATDLIAKCTLPPGLYGGYCGVAWVVQHLAGRLFEQPEEDELTVIDEAVESLLRPPRWDNMYDLVFGLTGFAVYALERLPRPSARQLLESIVTHLQRLGVTQASAMTWFTPPSLLPQYQREIASNGYYNLGVAHGVPGVIAALAQIHAAGITQDKTAQMLDGAVRWVLSQELAVDGHCRFPAWVGEGIEPTPTRLAWCYGDAGIAAALMLAARHLQRSDWDQEALRIARRAAACPPEQSGVFETCLCHGSAGLGHIFNRFYQATGDPNMAEAARFWLHRTIEMRRPAEGIAGLVFLRGKDDWGPDARFLSGASGCALALLAAISPVEPAWDRLLLTSIPL